MGVPTKEPTREEDEDLDFLLDEEVEDVFAGVEVLDDEVFFAAVEELPDDEVFFESVAAAAALDDVLAGAAAVDFCAEDLAEEDVSTVAFLVSVDTLTFNCEPEDDFSDDCLTFEAAVLFSASFCAAVLVSALTLLLVEIDSF